MKRLLLSIALGLATTPAIAQGEREPSAEALALAQALNPERVFIFEAATLDQMRSMIERSLLNSHYAPRGAPCEPRNGECAAIARQMAEREAPAMHARHKAAVERTYARYFDAHLSDAEIAAARAFLASASGRAFADAVAALAVLQTGEDDLSRIAMEEFTGTGVGATLYNEFYDRTAHLPRARQMRVAPPPAPPRPSPRPPEKRR